VGNNGGQAHLPYLNNTAWLVTLTYMGGVRVVPSYDTLGLPRHRWSGQCLTSPMQSVPVASVSTA